MLIIDPEITVEGDERTSGIVLVPARPGKGGNQAWDFFLNLGRADQRKFATLFERLAEPGQIENAEHFKQLKAHQTAFSNSRSAGGVFTASITIAWVPNAASASTAWCAAATRRA